MINNKQMIEHYLKANGYDGLYREDGYDSCGCILDDFMPCGEIPDDCVAAFKRKCNCGEHDFHLVPSKKTLKEGKHDKTNKP